MNIIPVCAFQDNYIWLLVQGQEVVCVDPGDAAPVAAYLAQHQLTLMAVWLTHAHADHTGGVAALCAAWPQAVVYGRSAWPGVGKVVGEGDALRAGSAAVQVWSVPGHTADHLAYVVSYRDRNHVFCGDTLFSAGCGRVLGGTVLELYHSLQRFNRLPENTLFYPAHEYTLANLRFAQAVEPHNVPIQAALCQAQQRRAAQQPTLPVTLAHERCVNPFLRCACADVRAAALRMDEAAAQEPLAVFTVLRAWKNRF